MTLSTGEGMRGDAGTGSGHSAVAIVTSMPTV